MIKSVYLFCFLLFISYCSSSQSFLIEKKLPQSEYSISDKGEVLLSTTRLEERAEGRRTVFLNWRFMGATSDHLLLRFEEYYDAVKDTPDLQKQKKLPLTTNIFNLEGARLIIYRLTPVKITYQIDTGGAG